MKLLNTFACLASAVAAAPSKVDKPASPLDVQIEMVGNSEVKAVFTNNGKDELKLLKSGTILDDTPVEKGEEAKPCVGNRVKFGGIRVRLSMAALNDQSFQRIGPSESVEVTFDIGEVHDLSTGGKYGVHAVGTIPYAKSDKNALVGSIRYESNKLEATVDGGMAATRHQAFNHKRTNVSKCSGDKLTDIETALDNCVTLSNAAKDAADSGSDDRMEEYFMSSTDDTRSTVSDVFSKVSQECSSTDSGDSDLYCEDPHGGCKSDTLAYTTTDKSYMVYCKLFFQDPDLTSKCHAQDKATTVIHEMTHLDEIKGTEDNAYGYDDLVDLSEEDALNNADTYAMFANAVDLDC